MKSYQERVAVHVAVVTEGDPTDVPERRDRFGEESLEVQQALGQTRAEAHALVDYVFDRPPGQPAAEIGGVLYTVTALANELRLDMAACAEAELARLSTPEATAKIRRKRATRHGRGALPGIDASPAPGNGPVAWFAEGAAARSGGRPRTQPPGTGAAWLAGWDACDGAVFVQ